MARRILMGFAVGLVTCLMLLVYVVPLIDFSVDNPWWNGYSRVRADLDAYVLNSPLTTLSNFPPDSSCLILIPYKPLSGDELSSLSRFVSDGGLLIILSDYGYGNEVLEYLDAPVRIDESGMLIDPLFNYRNGRLPKIFHFNVDRSTENISYIILNHASILVVLNPGAEVLGESSSFSYFDMDFDSSFDNEPYGPFPVFARFDYGRGVVYVLSDASLLLNSMVDLGDNLLLVKNIVGGRRVLLDQYHLRTNLHYQIRFFLLSIYGFVREIYILPYFMVGLITFVSYVILRKFFKSRGVT